MDGIGSYAQPVDNLIDCGCERWWQFKQSRGDGMNMSDGDFRSKGRTSKDELLRRLEEVMLDGDGNHNDATPGLSEAERLARDAVPPKRRVDGEMVGTPRQKPMTSAMMEFAKRLIEGKTQLEAYQSAYPNAKANERTLKTAAWKLTQDPRIQRMLQEHWGQTVEALTDDAVAVKRYVIKSLLDLSKDAKQEGSKLKALELMGKSVGMFKPAQAEEEESLTAEQLKQELAKHLKLVGNVRRITKAQIIDVPSSTVIGASVQAEPSVRET